MATVLFTQIDWGGNDFKGTSIFIFSVEQLPKVPIFVSAWVTDVGWAAMFGF
jgi:hypothetical protein